MSADALALIQKHVDALAALSLSDEDELPDAPDLTGLSLGAGDLEQARELLTELASVEARLVGMRVRVRGEMEGMRRSRPEPLAPSPRVLDTTA